MSWLCSKIEQCRLLYLLCLNSIFHYRLHKGAIFAICRLPIRLCSHSGASEEKASGFEQTLLILCVHCAFLAISEQRRYALCKVLAYILF